MGIIHFAVGVGIVSKYRQFGDTYDQQIGLSGYGIFIGIFSVAVGIIGALAVIKDHARFTKVATILSFVLGIFVLASLIAALALSGQAATHLHDTLTDNMNNYAQDERAIDIIDNIQTTYECCGVNLWLDWSRVALTPGGINVGRRRRRQQQQVSTTTSRPESPLARTIRRKKQYNGYDPIYNLPSTYNVILPISCCRNGGQSSGGNSLGGYCVFNAYNSTTSFYVSGCLEPISNRAFAQIAGIIVINTCLLILAFVNFGKLITIFKKERKADSEKNQYIDGNSSNDAQNSQQQYPDHPYYIDGYNQYPSYNYNYPNSNFDYNTPNRSFYL